MRLLATLVLLGGPVLIADVADATIAPESEAEPQGGCVAFGDPCQSGQRCCDTAGAFGVCHAFGQGSRCTIACPDDPEACPNEGRGCNHQSPPMCRSPRKGGGGKDGKKKKKKK